MGRVGLLPLPRALFTAGRSTSYASSISFSNLLFNTLDSAAISTTANAPKALFHLDPTFASVAVQRVVQK